MASLYTTPRPGEDFTVNLAKQEAEFGIMMKKVISEINLLEIECEILQVYESDDVQIDTVNYVIPPKSKKIKLVDNF